MISLRQNLVRKNETFFVFFVFKGFSYNAQNLIKNGGFEYTDFWKCVTNTPNPTNTNDIYGKPSFIYYHTFSSTDTLGSPFLLSTNTSNNNGNLCSQKCGVPNTQYGYKYPRNGTNFVFAKKFGIILFLNNFYNFKKDTV